MFRSPLCELRVSPSSLLPPNTFLLLSIDTSTGLFASSSFLLCPNLISTISIATSLADSWRAWASEVFVKEFMPFHEQATHRKDAGSHHTPTSFLVLQEGCAKYLRA